MGKARAQRKRPQQLRPRASQYRVCEEGGCGQRTHRTWKQKRNPREVTGAGSLRVAGGDRTAELNKINFVQNACTG